MRQPSDRVQVRRPLNNFVKRIDGRTIAALLLMTLTAILIAWVMTLPWWVVTVTAGSATTGFGTSTISWYLTKVCEGTGAFVASDCQTYQTSPALQSVFGETETLMLAGLVLSAGATALLMVPVVKPRIDIASPIVAAVGSALVLLSPLYLFVALPGVMASAGSSPWNTGFFGSTTQTGFMGRTTSTVWGGGIGWAMSFVAASLFVLATIVAFFALRRTTSIPGRKLERAVGTRAKETKTTLYSGLHVPPASNLQPSQAATVTGYPPFAAAPRRWNWILILGAVVIMFGAVMIAVTEFAFAALPSTATYDDTRGLYSLAGGADILQGIGFLLAFLGLAFPRRD